MSNSFLNYKKNIIHSLFLEKFYFLSYSQLPQITKIKTNFTLYGKKQNKKLFINKNLKYIINLIYTLEELTGNYVYNIKKNISYKNKKNKYKKIIKYNIMININKNINIYHFFNLLSIYFHNKIKTLINKNIYLLNLQNKNINLILNNLQYLPFFTEKYTKYYHYLNINLQFKIINNIFLQYFLENYINAFNFFKK